MNLALTKGNATDISMVTSLLENLTGKTDKGYISSELFTKLLDRGLQLITGVKKNMKNKLMTLQDKMMLRKRSLIETVFDILKNKFNLQHTRYRSPVNFMMHIASTLIAYQFRKNKPAISSFTTVF
jgi:hypothetical protein